MKTRAAVSFACIGLVTTLGAVAAGGQSPGLVSHYAGLLGTGSGYGPNMTPSLAFGGASNDVRRAVQHLAVTVRDLTGSPATQACKGFHNVGDCLAAAHASQNLGVSFESLRDNMAGKNGRPLSAVIESLRPDVDSGQEAAKALQQTRDDVSKA